MTVQHSPTLKGKKAVGESSKYYNDLEESEMLRKKQSENDPLKDYYEMQKTKKEEQLIENQENDFFNEFGSKERKYDSDYSDENFADPLSAGLKKRKSE